MNNAFFQATPISENTSGGEGFLLLLVFIYLKKKKKLANLIIYRISKKKAVHRRTFIVCKIYQEESFIRD